MSANNIGACTCTCDATPPPISEEKSESTIISTKDERETVTVTPLPSSTESSILNDAAKLDKNSQNSSSVLIVGIMFSFVLLSVVILLLFRMRLQKKKKNKRLTESKHGDSLRKISPINRPLARPPSFISNLNSLNRGDPLNLNGNTLSRAPTGPTFSPPMRGVTIMNTPSLVNNHTLCNQETLNRNSSPIPNENYFEMQRHSLLSLQQQYAMQEQYGYMPHTTTHRNPVFVSNIPYPVNQNFVYSYEQSYNPNIARSYNPQYFPQEYDPRDEEKQSTKFYVANPTPNEGETIDDDA
ncbi:hypothetical protein HK099_004251 [Clydaea vesicula]|uniref:Uncharacterized protein n=1 Tax=Clydaea vesicula TaxID=447962 RepID=A0AAD5XVQ3_9FUNG|nr:hypothetical protein HK099_004251 [Clydaea vesicula]